MTTSVKVDAHCAKDKEVVIIHDNTKVVIQDGESYDFVVYDNHVGTVFEQEKQ